MWAEMLASVRVTRCDEHHRMEVGLSSALECRDDSIPLTERDFECYEDVSAPG